MINQRWETPERLPDGGVSTGIGFTIAWQRGPLTSGRNGAFLLDVLNSCREQLIYFESGQFACAENKEALGKVTEAIDVLASRLSRRQSEGTLGTHTAD